MSFIDYLKHGIRGQSAASLVHRQLFGADDDLGEGLASHLYAGQPRSDLRAPRHGRQVLHDGDFSECLHVGARASHPL